MDDSTDLKDAFRAEVLDLEKPYLWSDAEIFRYGDEAQKKFCRLTDGIEDMRSPLTQLTIQPGQEWLEVSPKILKFRGATDAAGRSLDLVAADRVEALGIRFGGTAGRVRCLVQGFERNALRVSGTTTEPMPIKLSVFRLPLKKLDDEGVPLEIDDQHRASLLLWMKHLAYAKQDAETLDRAASRENYELFHEYCAAAKVEQHRRRFPVGAIQYGGL